MAHTNKVLDSRLVQKVLYWIIRQYSQLLVICFYDFYSLYYSLFPTAWIRRSSPLMQVCWAHQCMGSLPQPLDGNPFFYYFIAASIDIWLKIQCFPYHNIISFKKNDAGVQSQRGWLFPTKLADNSPSVFWTEPCMILAFHKQQLYDEYTSRRGECGK